MKPKDRRKLEIADAHNALDKIGAPRDCPEDGGRLSVGGRIRELVSRPEIIVRPDDVHVTTLDAAAGVEVDVEVKVEVGTADGRYDLEAIRARLDNLDEYSEQAAHDVKALLERLQLQDDIVQGVYKVYGTKLRPEHFLPTDSIYPLIRALFRYRWIMNKWADPVE